MGSVFIRHDGAVRRAHETVFVLALFGILLACDQTPPPQTVIRFAADDALTVPAGATVEVSFYADRVTQDQAPTSTQSALFSRDLQFVIDADQGDPSRRFTVFADLLDAAGTRISWSRVRTGFLTSGALGEVRVNFAAGCRPPADRARQNADYDPTTACGSHDTCASLGGETDCAPACLAPDPFNTEELEAEPSEAQQCEGSDCAPVARLTVGWSNSCATTETGVTFCWGRTHFRSRGEGLLDRPSLLLDEDGRASTQEVVAIDASSNYLCAVRDGQATCGGQQTHGQFGNTSAGYSALTTLPIAIDVPKPLTGIGVGVQLICVLDRDGAMYCSGSRPDIRGELDTFTRIDDEEGFIALHALRWGMCAQRPDRSLRCFGFDGAAGPFANRETPPFQHVSSGANSLCGVEDDGRVACFGWDETRAPYEEQPTYLPGRYRSVAVGRFFPTAGEETHRCAVDENGQLSCWGQNTRGSAGLTGDQIVAFAERNPIGTDTDWQQVAAARDHTCATKEDGRLFCFGDNTFSQLGAAGPSTETPRAVCVPAY